MTDQLAKVYQDLVMDIAAREGVAVISIGELSNLGAGLMIGVLLHREHPVYAETVFNHAVKDFPGGQEGLKRYINRLVKDNPIGGDDGSVKNDEAKASSTGDHDHEEGSHIHREAGEAKHIHHWRQGLLAHDHEGGSEDHDHSLEVKDTGPHEGHTHGVGQTGSGLA